MRLTAWLTLKNMTQTEFCRRISASQGKVSQLCNGGWMSRRMAERIMIITDGAVSPTDFLWPEHDLKEYEVPFDREEEPPVKTAALQDVD